MSNFIEIERLLDDAKQNLRDAKHAATLLALTQAVSTLNLELRNHIQSKASSEVPIKMIPLPSFPLIP